MYSRIVMHKGYQPLYTLMSIWTETVLVCARKEN